ncbi:caspase a-like isoform X2 [Cebidichthys violaceus]|uniref:caspase a-like isoform X2 n=1 Tax=Cebidichthys violaceus TaxID=271503 RepID=UPI0035CA5315
MYFSTSSITLSTCSDEPRNRSTKIKRDSVLEENSSTANKARSLIDMVRKKGDEASRKMIAHLQSRDPSLYSELGLSSGQPAQPKPQKEQQGPTTLIRTSEDFWREKLNDRDVYTAAKNSMRNRVALLIINIKFTDEKLNRKGAEKDEANMEKLLTALGYEVVKHINLTGKAIDDAVNDFSKLPKLKETDSVLVVIMSHGKLGAVLGVDWKKEISDNERPDEFLINNIYKHLGPEKCPALLNKPKIIIIQACRGEEEGSVLVRDGANPAVVCDNAGEENIEDDGLRFVNKEKDFISLLSCTPDTVSYRQTERGSFLIQHVVEVFNSFAQKDDVEELFRKVPDTVSYRQMERGSFLNQHVVEVFNSFAQKDDIEELFRKVMQRFEDFPCQTKRQMPTKDRCTLTKRFYFFPGL